MDFISRIANSQNFLLGVQVGLGIGMFLGVLIAAFIHAIADILTGE